MTAMIVIDRSLRDEAWSFVMDERYVVDRRHGERRRTAAPGGRRRSDRRNVVAPLLNRDSGALTLRYSCPQDGEQHEVSYQRDFARRYGAAAADRDCLCPGHESWFIRHGMRPRTVTLWALASLWLLNICDIVLTRQALQSGVAREANRFMGFVLGMGWLPALAFKIGIVSIGVAVLWRYRRSRLARSASMALAGFYTVVVLYQAVFVTLMH